jgi:hypothetical protein
MIEIAECMNNIAPKAVWRRKDSGAHLAKIHRVWWQGDKLLVGFHTWDYINESRKESFTKGGVMEREAFEAEHYYEAASNYNAEREKAKTEYLIGRARDEIVDSMRGGSIEDREECKSLLAIFEKLVRCQLAEAVEDHSWDEGCATGCCGTDPYQVAAAIKDEMDATLTPEEIERLMPR